MAVRKGAILFLFLCTTWSSSSAECDANDVAVYRMVLDTFWTEQRFPKNYPQYRPRAKWAQGFGQSHDSSYHLFSIGEVASEELRQYSQSGAVSGLVEAGEEDPRVYDQFATSPITDGDGSTENVFFVDGAHSLVSLVNRMAPSPDWFVGVDSLQLCVDSSWIDEISMSLEPLDAGASSGLSYTSPRWETSPPALVSRHTAREPAHSAAAFFYPHLRHLPTIAAVRFTKIKEYSNRDLTDLVHKEMRNELNVAKEKDNKPATEKPPVVEFTTKTKLEMLKDLEEEPVGIPKPNIPSNHVIVITEGPTTNSPAASTEGEFGLRSADDVILAVAHGRLLGRGEHLPRHFRDRLNRAVNRITEEDCLVSEWGAWSACSATCGLGARVRSRHVLRAPTPPRGRACPPLAERDHCGDANSCYDVDYFRW